MAKKSEFNILPQNLKLFEYLSIHWGKVPEYTPLGKKTKLKLSSMFVNVVLKITNLKEN